MPYQFDENGNIVSGNEQQPQSVGNERPQEQRAFDVRPQARDTGASFDTGARFEFDESGNIVNGNTPRPEPKQIESIARTDTATKEDWSIDGIIKRMMQPASAEELAQYQPTKTENYFGISTDTPIVGGLARAFGQAFESPTTTQHLDSAIRDIPVLGQLARGAEATFNLLNEPYEAVGKPIQGYLSAGLQEGANAIENMVGGNRPTGDILNERIAKAKEMTGIQDPQDFWQWVEIGKAMSAQDPAFAQAGLAIALDPLNLLPGAGLGSKAIDKAQDLSRAPMAGALKTVEELTGAGAKERGILEKINPFALTKDSKIKESLRDAGENLIGHLTANTIDDGRNYLKQLENALKSPTMYDKLAETFGDSVRTRGGQLGVRLSEGLGKVGDDVGREMELVRQAITRGDNATTIKVGDAFREAMTKAAKVGADPTRTAQMLEDAARTEMAYRAGETLAKNAERVFGKAEPNGLQRIWNGMKGIEGLLYIGLSPMTFVRNVVNNKVTLLMEGVNPFVNYAKQLEQIQKINPTKANLLRQVQQMAKSQTQLRDALNSGMKLSAYGGSTPNFLKGFPSLNKFYASAEAQDRALAWTTGTLKALKTNWAEGKWLPSLDASTHALLSTIDPTLPKQITAAVEIAGLDKVAQKRLVESVLDGKLPLVDMDTLAQGMSARLGQTINADQLRAMLGQEGDAVMREFAENIARGMRENKPVAQVIAEAAAPIERKIYEMRPKDIFASLMSESPLQAGAPAYTDEMLRALVEFGNEDINPSVKQTVQDLYKLASDKGIATATEAGRPFDRALLNTLNKYKPDNVALFTRENLNARIDDAVKVLGVVPNQAERQAARVKPVNPLKEFSGSVKTQRMSEAEKTQLADAWLNIGKAQGPAPVVHTLEDLTNEVKFKSMSKAEQNKLADAWMKIDNRATMQELSQDVTFKSLTPQEQDTLASAWMKIDNRVAQVAPIVTDSVKLPNGSTKVTHKWDSRNYTVTQDIVVSKNDIQKDLRVIQKSNGEDVTWTDKGREVAREYTNKKNSDGINFEDYLKKAEIEAAKAKRVEVEAAAKARRAEEEKRFAELLKAADVQAPGYTRAQFHAEIDGLVGKTGVTQDEAELVKALWDARANTAVKEGLAKSVDEYLSKRLQGVRAGGDLSADALKQVDTDTAAFKKWFGGSKVVDAEGKPLVVYHGTPKGGFTEFEPSLFGTTSDAGYYGGGFYFSSSPDEASLYSKKLGGNRATVYPAYISINSPFVVDFRTAESAAETMTRAKQAGIEFSMSGFITNPENLRNKFDGVIAWRSDRVNAEVVAFDPTQIKSAIGNRGTFNPNSANILEQGAQVGVKGAVSFADDGRAMLKAFETADVSTLAHESAHIWRRDLSGADLQTIEEWAGVVNGKWDVAQEEKFARAFERYLAEGQAPVPELQRLFNDFKDWLLMIYEKIVGSEIDVNMTANVRDVFDNLLAGAEISAAKADWIKQGTKEYVQAERKGGNLLHESVLSDFFKPNGDAKDIWYNRQTREFRFVGDKSPLFGIGASRGTPDKSGNWIKRPINEAGEAGQVIVQRLAENNMLPPGILNEGDDFTRLQEIAQQTRGARATASGKELFQRGKANRAQGEMFNANMEQRLGKLGGNTLDKDAWNAEQAKFLDEFMQVLKDELAKTRATVATGDAKTRVMQWLNRDVAPASTDAARAAMKHGDWLEGATVMNYDGRWNLDQWMSWITPFPFWRNHFAAETLRRAVDHPQMALAYLKASKALDEQQNSPDYPARFRGKTAFPMPFLPDWMGGTVLFDPLESLQPIKQAFSARKYNDLSDNDIATAIRAMASKGMITEADATLALTQKNKSALWQQVQKDMYANQSSYDPVLDLFSTHLPIQMASKLLKGDAQQIGAIFPFTRLARGVSAMGIPGVSDVAGKVAQAEPALRKWAGIPEYEAGYQYRIDRSLANMVGDGTVTARDALIAMMERKGKAYEMAVQRANAEQGVQALSPFTGSQVFPTGERETYRAYYERNALLDKVLRNAGEPVDTMGSSQKWERASALGLTKRGSELYEYMRAHPEMDTKASVFEEQEKRLKDFLVSEIWDKYNGMSALDKKFLSKELGDDFASKFVSRDRVKDYANVTLDELATWAKALGGYVPGADGLNVKAANTPTYQKQDARDSFAYNEYNAMRDSYFGDYANYQRINEGYYALPEKSAARGAYVKAHPELKEWWDYKAAWEKQNPTLNLALDAQNAQRGYTLGGNAQPVSPFADMGALGTRLEAFYTKGTKLSEGDIEQLLRYKERTGNREPFTAWLRNMGAERLQQPQTGQRR